MHLLKIPQAMLLLYATHSQLDTLLIYHIVLDIIPKVAKWEVSKSVNDSRDGKYSCRMKTETSYLVFALWHV